MDPITQGALGAAVAACFSKKPTVRKAVLIGALSGMAPDLDIVIRSHDDPLLKIEYHRHFTHSLAFVPIGALLMSFFFWLFPPIRKLGFKKIYLFAFLGYGTHGLLDACTTYGTSLYWPFTDTRISWNLISIIDPLYTIPMLVLVLFAVIRQRPRLAQWGLALSFFYMAVNGIQHYRVNQAIAELAKERGQTITRSMITPEFSQNVHWRSIYQAGDYYYLDAVSVPFFQAPNIRTGSKTAVLNPETIFPTIPADSQQRADIERFSLFTQGYFYQSPENPLLLGDLRYSSNIKTLSVRWGILLTPNDPEAHAQFTGFSRK